MRALTDGTVLRGLVSGQLNVRANTRSGASIGSVRMALSGAASSSRTEGIAPYALFGDRGGRAFAPGSYTVTATPYPERGLSGTAGKTRSVTFRVVLPALSVADARAEEGTDETIDFAVTLDAASRGRVTVDYATSDGTAKAGADYTAASGTLTFEAGETAKTVSVAVLDDAVDEGGERFTLRLSNPSGATLADGEATGTIENSDPMPQAWIARFGRTVASSVVGAVTSRLEGGGGSHVTLGGQRLGGSGEAVSPEALRRLEDAARGRRGDGEGARRTMTERAFLLGTSFHLASENEAVGPSFAAWGRVEAGRFDAGEDGLRMDGEATTGVVGADVSRERWLAGAAVSHSKGEGSFGLSATGSAVDGGKVESTLTGVYPYGRLSLSDRVTAWGLAGYGTGTLTLTNEGDAAIETDLSMTMGAVGGRGTLLSAPETGGFELALKTDALWMRMTSDEAEGLEGAEADASRLRLIVDASRRFELDGATLTPSLELGLRLDGGDAETGTGVEVGAGIRYAGSGVTVEGSVRGLIAHEASGYEEWGASGSVRIDPGASGRGFSLTLTPSWGKASSGAKRLWSLPDAGGLARDDDFEARSRLEAEVGYGLGAPGGLGVVTPYAGLRFAGGGERWWRAGARWQAAPGASLSLEGARRESGNDGAAEHGVMLQAAVRW